MCPSKSESDIISTQDLIFLDFSCAYDSVYADIIANEFTVVSDSLEGNSETGLGQLNLSLKQYMDSEMTDQADADDQFPLGGTMYFQLAMDNPVSSLDLMISG